jgi:hypothetical protein
MEFAWAQWVVLCLGAYLSVGAIFALAFVATGVGRIDVAARGMPWSARILIFPGVVALWPLMLQKWLTQRETPAS